MLNYSPQKGSTCQFFNSHLFWPLMHSLYEPALLRVYKHNLQRMLLIHINGHIGLISLRQHETVARQRSPVLS